MGFSITINRQNIGFPLTINRNTGESNSKLRQWIERAFYKLWMLYKLYNMNKLKQVHEHCA